MRWQLGLERTWHRTFRQGEARPWDAPSAATIAGSSGAIRLSMKTLDVTAQTSNIGASTVATVGELVRGVRTSGSGAIATEPSRIVSE